MEFSEMYSELVKIQEFLFMDLDDASDLEKEAIRSILFPKDPKSDEDDLKTGVEDKDEQEKSRSTSGVSSSSTHNPVEHKLNVNFGHNEPDEVVDESWSSSEGQVAYERWEAEKYQVVQMWGNDQSYGDDDAADCKAVGVVTEEDPSCGCKIYPDYPQMCFQLPTAPWLCCERTPLHQQQYPSNVQSNGFYTCPEPNVQRFPSVPSTPLIPLSPVSPNMQFQTFWSSGPYQAAPIQIGDWSVTSFEPLTPRSTGAGSVFGSSQLVPYPIQQFGATDFAVALRKRKRNRKHRRHYSSSFYFYNSSGDDYCHFCWKNNETRAVYTSHTLRNANGELTCPILMRHVCPICKQTGVRAHTERFCPVRNAKEDPSQFLTTRKGALASVGRNPFRA